LNHKKITVEPIRKYLHPNEFVDWNKSDALKKQQEVKKKSISEVYLYITTCPLLVDSLFKNGEVSDFIADFYRNKFQNQFHLINLLENKYDIEAIKVIFKNRSCLNFLFRLKSTLF
jgi:hypothetical protein